MQTKTYLAKTFVLGFATAALVLGAITLTSPAVSAQGPGGPLCGPTLQWSCSKIGGPSQLFVGTVCAKKRFEKKTGTSCVPLGS